MLNEISLSNALDAVVPITRFNRGEANKIFDEVSGSGYKVVLKNNAPACVLLSPDRYCEIIDEYADLRMHILTLQRMFERDETIISAEDVYSDLGISLSDLDNISMEYGVDFE